MAKSTAGKAGREESTMNDSEVGSIIERGVRKYRGGMEGAILRPQQANYVATQDAIRHFADGLGDPNPLWRSEDYARRSIHGSVVAPPQFLNAISEGQAIVGLPGLLAVFVGADWEWFRVIRLGDSFSVTNRLLKLVDKSGGQGPRRFMQSGILTYTNQRGEVAGTCKWSMMRTEMKPGQGKKHERHDSDKPQTSAHRYSEDELASIYTDIEAEEIRGNKPRYFEDVKEGDELKPVVKGPLSLSDMIAWAVGIGWRRIGRAHGPKLLYLRDHPGLSYLDPETGAPEPIANSHFLPSAAKILLGSDLPLDLGFQRVCWLGHPVTNWTGDHGFLRSLRVRLSGMVRFGDTNWCKGTVARKWREQGEHLVELDLSCANQRGEINASGKAVVSLP
jgi:acyl dehydratase